VCVTHLRIKNIKSDRENHESLKLNGTHQFLVYADDVCVCVCVCGGGTHTTKKNTVVLVVAG
jgi:hypothetical protein